MIVTSSYSDAKDQVAEQKEQRRKQPDAPARAYLVVIARDPAAIAALLREAA